MSFDFQSLLTLLSLRLSNRSTEQSNFRGLISPIQEPTTPSSGICPSKSSMDKGGVIGLSGAGKSTFIDLFLALLEPDRGNVRVDGVDWPGKGVGGSNRLPMCTSVYLMNDTLRRNVALGMNEEDVDDLLVMEALEKARLADLVKSLPNGLDTEIGERGGNMSGGQIQRIGIARALFCDRTVLVFDEPTSALDGANEQHFLDVISQLKGTKTIVLVTHRDVMLETCDVIIKFDEGRAVTEQRN